MIARAFVGLIVALTLVPTATTLSAWTDAEVVAGSPSATVNLTPTVTCEPGLGQATISWPAGSQPTAHSYTVLKDDDPVDGLKLVNGRYTVDILSLLGTVVTTRTYVIKVQAGLPQTSWTATTTVRVRSGLLGALVSCPTTSYG